MPLKAPREQKYSVPFESTAGPSVLPHVGSEAIISATIVGGAVVADGCTVVAAGCVDFVFALPQPLHPNRSATQTADRVRLSFIKPPHQAVHDFCLRRISTSAICD